MYIIAYILISFNRRLPVYVGFEELHTPSAMRPTLCELFVSLILLFQTEWTGGIWSRIRKNSQVWNNFLVVGLFERVRKNVTGRKRKGWIGDVEKNAEEYEEYKVARIIIYDILYM